MDTESREDMPPHPVTIYGLNMGGCVALSRLTNHTILLDRSVIRRLEALSRPNNSVKESDRYWLAMLDDSKVRINVGLSSLEGFQRPLGFTEFFDHHDEVRTSIAKLLPSATVLYYERKDQQKIYAVQQEREARFQAESQFLCEIAPLLAQRPADDELDAIAQVLQNSAELHHLAGRSLVVVAAFACHFADKHGATSGALGVLKPKQKYSAAQAHNAICDLAALEVLIGASTLNVGPTAICTADKPQATFWEDLGAHAVERHSPQGFEYAYAVDRLFPRLSNGATAQTPNSRARPSFL